MSKPTIICVDDEQIVRTSLKAELREAFGDNFSIETAEGGEDALEVVDDLLSDKNSFPVVISDYIMPGLKGDELLKRIHQLSPKTLKIMLTGQADTQAVGNAIKEAKLYRYISKPWDSKDLILTVREALHAFMQAERIEKQNLELREINHDLEQKVLEQEKTLRIFMKYVPPPVVEKALNAREESIFDGELRDIAVLFCDIRDFTPLSEKLEPKDVVALLNDYYTLMTKIVKRHEGSVNQFVGDEVLATFGAPLMTSDNENNAVFCALEMLERLDEINDKYEDRYGLSINVGIGINCGKVVAGNLGSEDKIEYSVTGDVVNTGKRIESLTKKQPNTILISDAVFHKVKESVKTSVLDPIEVKGKAVKLVVHEVLGLKTLS